MDHQNEERPNFYTWEAGARGGRPVGLTSRVSEKDTFKQSQNYMMLGKSQYISHKIFLKMC